MTFSVLLDSVTSPQIVIDAIENKRDFDDCFEEEILTLSEAIEDLILFEFDMTLEMMSI